MKKLLMGLLPLLAIVIYPWWGPYWGGGCCHDHWHGGCHGGYHGHCGHHR